MITNDNTQLWQSVLKEIGPISAGHNNLLKGTTIVKLEEGIVHVAVPNVFVKDWLYDKMHKTLLRLLRGRSDTIRGISYIITTTANHKKEVVIAVPERQATAELPLQDYYVNKDDNLNPRYTFDSFVVGPFNELANVAARAVIDKPGTAYNPLFIYGDTGRGKTHLIQAIGNQMKKAFPAKKVYYITSEKFAVDYMSSVQNQRVNQFKEKYRVYDILIMDDIQFFSNKEKSQEELFHLFNYLYDNNKQIIFSSDKHPHYIQNLEERLKSRFNAGMIVDIPAPDHESRAAIIKAKAGHHNLDLQADIIDFLAQTIESNIREIEGVVNSIVMNTQIKARALNLGEVKGIIKGNARPKKSVSAKDIIKTIAQFYDIEEKTIYEKSRKKEVVRPRQIIMYILREDFDTSYPSIGEKMGGRDHTTVIHSCEKIKNDLKEDPVLADEIERIRSMIHC